MATGTAVWVTTNWQRRLERSICMDLYVRMRIVLIRGFRAHRHWRTHADKAPLFRWKNWLHHWEMVAMDEHEHGQPLCPSQLVTFCSTRIYFNKLLSACEFGSERGWNWISSCRHWQTIHSSVRRIWSASRCRVWMGWRRAIQRGDCMVWCHLVMQLIWNCPHILHGNTKNSHRNPARVEQSSCAMQFPKIRTQTSAFARNELYHTIQPCLCDIHDGYCRLQHVPSAASITHVFVNAISNEALLTVAYCPFKTRERLHGAMGRQCWDGISICYPMRWAQHRFFQYKWFSIDRSKRAWRIIGSHS